MPSIRNTRTSENLYLDAALECILDVGVKRTTMTDIARRAGVARMTIYRKWPDMPALLGDLMVREWVAEAEDLAGTVDTPTDAATIAALVVEITSSMRRNALFAKIVDVDPEFLIPYVFFRRGRTQDAMLDMIRAQLVAGQSAGTIRSGDPDVMARAIMLTALGFTLSMRTMTDHAKPADLDAELLLQMQRSLAP